MFICDISTKESLQQNDFMVHYKMLAEKKFYHMKYARKSSDIVLN